MDFQELVSKYVNSYGRYTEQAAKLLAKLSQYDNCLVLGTDYGFGIIPQGSMWPIAMIIPPEDNIWYLRCEEEIIYYLGYTEEDFDYTGEPHCPFMISFKLEINLQ